MTFSKYRFFTFLIGITAATALAAAPIDEAKRLYRNGNYDEAVTRLRRIVKRSPRDGNANFYLGMSLRALGKHKEAAGPLGIAEDKGIGAASEALAYDALGAYRASDAEKHIDIWESNLKKAKKPEPESMTALKRKATQMKNMLDRVERLEIIDSLTVDSAAFFNAYHLSPAAGSIVSAEMLARSGMVDDFAELGTAYLPQRHNELLWSASTDGEKFSLYGADILDDGTVDNIHVLDESLAGGGNALYPFLMPDGLTLYFAADGESSLGGLDIYMTRRSEDGYFQPQNMGMPYNSPDNDFMLAIDETSGLGWWATDRNHIPDKVTIYIFAPTPVRINAEPNDRNLRSLAKLDNIALTRKNGVNYKAMLAERLPHDHSYNKITARSARFAIDMGNGKVYTVIGDFKNQEAKSAMIEYLSCQASVNNVEEELVGLRRLYADGDDTTAADILDAEAELDMLRRRALSLRNKAIRLENNK